MHSWTSSPMATICPSPGADRQRLRAQLVAPERRLVIDGLWQRRLGEANRAAERDRHDIVAARMIAAHRDPARQRDRHGRAALPGRERGHEGRCARQQRPPASRVLRAGDPVGLNVEHREHPIALHTVAWHDVPDGQHLARHRLHGIAHQGTQRTGQGFGHRGLQYHA
jgi:hypothetical protein